MPVTVKRIDEKAGDANLRPFDRLNQAELARALSALRWFSKLKLNPSDKTFSILRECEELDQRYDLFPDERIRLKRMYLSHPTHGPRAAAVRLLRRYNLIVEYHERFYAGLALRSYKKDAYGLEKTLRAFNLSGATSPVSPRRLLERKIIDLYDGDIPSGEMIRRAFSGWLPGQLPKRPKGKAAKASPARSSGRKSKKSPARPARG
jgi:hypothetical protein